MKALIPKELMVLAACYVGCLMRRWLWVLCAGCGRLGFDPRVSPSPDAIVADAPLVCPSGYTIIDGGCYRVVSNDGAPDWAAAEAACELDGPTAHLAVIDSHAELVVLEDLLRTTVSVDAVVGFTDRLVEGEYRTVTGVPVFLEFAADEPDGNKADCGGLSIEVGFEGMEDVGCADGDDYICEVDRLPPAGTF